MAEVEPGSGDSSRRLRPEQWAQFVDAHSLPDARPETFEFVSIEVDGRTLRARCRMVWHRLRPDGSWHLRAAVAAQISSELKKIHAHLLDGLETRQYTALLTHLEMNFLGAVRDPERIDIELRLIDQQVSEKDGRIVKRLTWEFDFCDGAFVCQSTAQYRRPAEPR